MSLLTIETRRDHAGFLHHSELLTLCQDAAAYAVRPPYGPEDRADCAADIYGDIIAAVSREDAGEIVQFAPTRCDRGRPRDVLRWIDRAEAEAPKRRESAMPRRDDRRVMWTSVKNRAMDWRKAADVRKVHDALFSGLQEDRTAPAQDEALLADYLTAGAAQDRARGARAAEDACKALGLPARIGGQPTGLYLVLYSWARGHDNGAETADELKLDRAAYRQRVARAMRDVRDLYSVEDLVEVLMGSPVTVETAEGEEVRFALQDRSREAPHSWAPDVSEYFQGGPDRARRAYIGPRAVRQLRTAPDPDAPARRAAYDEDRARARASRTLGALGGKGAETHAGTHAKRARLGRTAGKAPEAYASRETRLGPDVRR